MALLERISTAGMRPRQRVEFWNELCSARAPAEARPLDLDTFEPACTQGSAGGLPLCEIKSSPSTVEHNSAHVARTREALYFLCLQTQGTSVHRQGGREAHLKPGDITLMGTGQPYEMLFAETNTMLVFALAEPVLQREIPCPQSVVATRMSYQDNLVRMLSDFAAGLWRECGDPDLDAVGSSLTSALMHMVGGAYARISQAAARGSASLESRRFQILGFIENHLRDEDLTPSTIAAQFKSSPRSLHMLFSNGPETLCQYILRRRLEECARALTSPVQHARTISDVAFDHGFSSSAHFCKVFRNHFGTTPTEYRHQRVAGEAPATPHRRARDERELISR